jgi:hypothetical protein
MVRARAREFIEEMIRGEPDTVLARPRYSRSQMAGNEGRAGIGGHRHGSRTRSLTGTFGAIEIAVPRARLNTSEGKTTEWKSQALRAIRSHLAHYGCGGRAGGSRQGFRQSRGWPRSLARPMAELLAASFQKRLPRFDLLDIENVFDESNQAFGVPERDGK